MAVPWHLSSGNYPNSRWQWCLCTGHCPGSCHLSLSCKTPAACTRAGEPHPSPTEKPLKQPHPRPWRRAVYLKYMPTTLRLSDGQRDPLLVSRLGPFSTFVSNIRQRTLAGGQVRRSGNNNSILYLFLGTSQYFYILKNWLLRYFLFSSPFKGHSHISLPVNLHFSSFFFQ